MDIQNKVQQIDELVAQGAIVDAVKTHFADQASTSDYNEVKTQNKAQMIEKMEGFTGAIAEVNGIKHHQTLVNGRVSVSEFTFDFQMKDGGQIYWHEIIKRTWNDEGLVIAEEYFKAN